MTYSLHGSSASDLAVQRGTDADIAEYLGGDSSDSTERRLVLNDPGNLHALIIQGNPAELRALALRITGVANQIEKETS
jgi:hypothetical protein